jgi:hypothetical protein
MVNTVILAAEGKINPLVPHTAELIVGAIAFTLLFLVLRSKVVPMFEKAFTARKKHSLKHNAHLVSTTINCRKLAKKHKHFAKKHAFKAQPLLKNFALKLRKKQHA